MIKDVCFNDPRSTFDGVGASKQDHFLGRRLVSTRLWRRLKGAASYAPQNQPESVGLYATLTVPELEQSKAAVLNTLASQHSRRSYEYAIERFIAWYCSEPRLTFNRSVVVKYRSFLERLSLSAATINLHLSAIRRL